jgi:hypothetical protein
MAHYRTPHALSSYMTCFVKKRITSIISIHIIKFILSREVFSIHTSIIKFIQVGEEFSNLMDSNTENDIILTIKLVKIRHVRSRTRAWRTRPRPECEALDHSAILT